MNCIQLLAFSLAAGLGFSAAAANPDNFTVPSATGAGAFTLADAKGKFVALHFLLKTECPVCLRHTRDYQTKAATLSNVVQVFLKPDSEAEIKGWSANLSADALTQFPIHRDADARLAKLFGIPDGYRFHGQVVHYPALVRLVPDGKEFLRHVGKNNGDRLPFDKLRAKVAELGAK